MRIENVVFVNIDAAGPAELAPDVDQLAVLAEDLDAIVVAVGDIEPALAVHRQRMRHVESSQADAHGRPNQFTNLPFLSKCTMRGLPSSGVWPSATKISPWGDRITALGSLKRVLAVAGLTPGVPRVRSTLAVAGRTPARRHRCRRRHDRRSARCDRPCRCRGRAETGILPAPKALTKLPLASNSMIGIELGALAVIGAAAVRHPDMALVIHRHRAGRTHRPPGRQLQEIVHLGVRIGIGVGIGIGLIQGLAKSRRRRQQQGGAQGARKYGPVCISLSPRHSALRAGP